MAYSLRLRPFQLLSLWRYHREGTQSFARGAVAAFLRIKGELESLVGRPSAGMRLLEIGAGQRYHNVALFRASGADVTGIDLEPVGPGMAKYLAMLRHDGPGRVLKSLVRALFFDRAYFRELESAFGSAVPRRGLDLRAMDAGRLAFAERSFDAVISTAVFEHLPDLESAVKEMARVLRPGGVCRIAIHLFPSLSGGHHLEWQAPSLERPPQVPAWDHLRENRFPSHSYLNRLRKRDYVECFARHFDIVEQRISRGGEEWLDPGLETELKAKGFERDELLETELLIVARPKA